MLKLIMNIETRSAIATGADLVEVVVKLRPLGVMKG